MNFDSLRGLFQLLLGCLLVYSSLAQRGGGGGKGDKGGKGGKGGKGKDATKTTKIFKTMPTKTTTPDCASISLFRYQHLVAMNWTTTSTVWPEVARIRKRMADNHPRNSIIIDVLRTKFNLMTEKQEFKVEFNRFKKYILKIGGNGTRFLPQFMDIAAKNLQFEQRVSQIDSCLKRYGMPRYTHINMKFTYITKVNTPPLNYTPTEKISKLMWYKTSVLDVRYNRYLEKKNNPIIWEDLNAQTPGAWHGAIQNLPGFRHHARKFNNPLKKERKANKTRLFYMKLAEMRRLNITGDPRLFNGTLMPRPTEFIVYEQPDVMGPINRYFNACSIGGPNDPWARWIRYE